MTLIKNKNNSDIALKAVWNDFISRLFKWFKNNNKMAMVARESQLAIENQRLVEENQRLNQEKQLAKQAQEKQLILENQRLVAQEKQLILENQRLNQEKQSAKEAQEKQLAKKGQENRLTPNGEEGKKKRVAAKNIFLTYSKVSSDLTHQYILDFIKGALQIKYYIVAREFHEDGTPHFHLLISSFSKFDFTLDTINIPDPADAKQAYVPHYKPVYNYATLAQYCYKNNDYIHNVPQHLSSVKGQIIYDDKLLKRLKEENVEDIIREMMTKDPKVVKNVTSLRRDFTQAQALIKSEEEEEDQPLVPFTGEDFKEVEAAIIQNEKDVDIRVCFGSVLKRKGMVQVITCNTESVQTLWNLLKKKASF